MNWDGTLVPGSAVTNAGVFGYTEYSFMLHSIGSDTLQFEFRNDPGFWGLDDISVVQNVPAVPEPSAVLLLGAVLGLLGWRFRRRALN